MNILMVLTSHDRLGDTGKKTGFWLEEFAAPYYAFLDAGVNVTLASPAGGQPPLDPSSDTEDTQTKDTTRFKDDKDAQEHLANTKKLADMNAEDFDSVFYPGGHGPLWDLAVDENSINLIETFVKQDKPVAFVCHSPAALKNVKVDGEYLVKGKTVTGFTNSEEDAVGLTDVVPFLVEDALKANGGNYEKAADWESFVVEDGLLVTGQNPASSEEAAKRLMTKLKGQSNPLRNKVDTMIRLHHLNQSRSLRTLWLLEELGVPYEVVSHQRDAKTHLAPDSLKAVHPLGKSPVIEMDGQIYAESGAITELLIERFAPERLRPATDSSDYGYYLQWIDFAESSLMLPLMLELFTKKAGIDDNEFLSGYIDTEKTRLFEYLDASVKGKSFIVGDKLSGADFMLSFDLIILAKRQKLDAYPNIRQYAEALASLDSYQRAMQLEAKYDQSVQHCIITDRPIFRYTQTALYRAVFYACFIL